MKVKTIFCDELDKEVLEFMSKEDLQLDVDHFFTYDVYLHMAHNIMQCCQGYLKPDELVEILKGLKEILGDYPSLKRQDFIEKGIEDVHSLIEFLLKERIGDTGLKARFNLSRNEEIATLQQMKLRREAVVIALKTLDLCGTLLSKAEGQKEVVMPAFTHLKVAQPTTLGYYWLSKVDQLVRVAMDLKFLFQLFNLSPLGACAISGAPQIEGVGIDRQLVARLLGFDGVMENTIDAVSSRGELALRFLSAANSLMVSCFSKLCEDVVVWSSLGMVRIGEGFVTGSSVVPQKANPDVAELIRAKAGRILGNFIKVAAISKALPTGYNRDFQEVKPALLESIEVVKGAIDAANGMVRAFQPVRERMASLLSENWSTATDLVNVIAIRFGVPYRKAYLIVKNFVKGKSLEEASEEVLGKSITLSEEELDDILDPAKSISRRNFRGGPSPSEVAKAIGDRSKTIQRLKNWFVVKGKETEMKLSNLENLVLKIVESRTFDKEFVKF